MDATPNDLERIIGELEQVLADCRCRMLLSQSQDYIEKLGEAADRIEIALGLLRSEAHSNVAAPDVENPVRGLPSCSIASCRMPAAAVVDGRQLCGSHASEALERRRT
jgi:hypothetical protein